MTGTPPSTSRLPLGARRALTLSLLALLLLGAVAAAGSGVGIGSATLRRNPTSLTFTVAVTLFGLFAVAALLWMVSTSLRWRRRAGGNEAPPSRPRRLVAAVPILALLLLLLFVGGRHRLRLPSLRPGAGRVAHTHAHAAVAFVPTASISTVAVVVVVAALVVLRSRLRGRRRHRPLAHLERSFYGGDWPEGQPGSLSRTLAEVEVPDPEQEPDPRRAVVAAYLAMTHAAGESGAVRRVDETASEFLERFLDAAGASADAAGHLTAVFEVARYSTRPVDESLRSSAIAALRRVRDELGAAV